MSKINSVVVLLSALLVGCQSAPASDQPVPPSPEVAEQLRQELMAMMEVDQEVRRIDFGSLSQDERRAAADRAAQVDMANTARMKEILDAHGWPSYSMVGREASDAAFLIIQHADRDPAFQERCLPIVQDAHRRGEASGAAVAYLTDRVFVKLDRPQRYGTQYYVREHDDGSVMLDEDGRPTYLVPIVEDRANLDAWRAEMGLGPWSEYEASIAPMQEREPVAEPRQWDGRLPVDPQR